jgi:rubrerythrin
MADYIDREVLIAFLKRVRKQIPHDIKDFNTRDCMLLNLEQFVSTLPSADVVEVRHGEWLIQKKQAPNGRRILYEIKTCSVCGKTHGRHKPNYCPNCGAKMDGADKCERE